MSLRLPRCEYCEHFKGYRNQGIVCDAFPDGVPDSKNIYDYTDSSECANGIKFKETVVNEKDL